MVHVHYVFARIHTCPGVRSSLLLARYVVPRFRVASHRGDDLSFAEASGVLQHVVLVELVRPGRHGADGAVGELRELSGSPDAPIGLRLGNELHDLEVAIGGDGVEAFHLGRAVLLERSHAFLVEPDADVDVDIAIVLAVSDVNLMDSYAAEPLAGLHVIPLVGSCGLDLRIIELSELFVKVYVLT